MFRDKEVNQLRSGRSLSLSVPFRGRVFSERNTCQHFLGDIARFLGRQGSSIAEFQLAPNVANSISADESLASVRADPNAETAQSLVPDKTPFTLRRHSIDNSRKKESVTYVSGTLCHLFLRSSNIEIASIFTVVNEDMCGLEHTRISRERPSFRFGLPMGSFYRARCLALADPGLASGWYNTPFPPIALPVSDFPYHCDFSRSMVRGSLAPPTRATAS